MKIFLIYYHSIIFVVLLVICMFSEIFNNEKYSKDKKEYPIGETIILFIIMIADVIAILYFISYILAKNLIAAACFLAVCGIVYVYIAIKQVIKMTFISEKRTFTFPDIKNFTFAYMAWCIMLIVESSTESGGGIIEKIFSTYGDEIKVWMLYLWYYFNFLFALGGCYILLYYLLVVVKWVAAKFDFRPGKIKNIVNKICNLCQRGVKFAGLKSFRLWRENNGKSATYKIFMTIPLFVFDICTVTYLFAKIFIGMTFAIVILSIFDPIRVLYKYVKNLLNRYKNNEWMYLFAQIAGLFSYVIVFLIIQYGKYEEITKKIFEFVGTIILIPYFINKIVRVNKNRKEDDAGVNSERGEEHSIPDNMVYNEDGEGVINGKTVRQLEAEALQNAVNDSEFDKAIDDKKLSMELRSIARKAFRKKIKGFIKDNVEILVGICISAFLISIYFIFKSPDMEQNISMIGSIIGAEGAMLSILISIAFMKKSNEKTLDASVLPYLTVKKENKPAGRAYAFEYIKDADMKRNFSIWRTFDFNTIRDDKIKLVRNGIAYLHIKNIGIGPAIYLKMKIENFSYVFLPIDYLRPDDELYLILNFNNPDESCKTDIIFEYETIRGERHVQKFHANITWHLDRTNFTLF